MSDLGDLIEEALSENFEDSFTDYMAASYDESILEHEQELWEQTVRQLNTKLPNSDYIPPRTPELQKKADELIKKIERVYDEWRDFIWDDFIQYEQGKPDLEAQSKPSYDDIPF